ncbi:PorP/SprF family type IX secretion system membrane protein [Pedobacter aquatilis]|uniref:PorP/SprF family type IX secretion system membrane protein n=1 Tax=Pedobacter aquatilis TaxID=351343 RepID=UPI0025B2DDF3|nr:PorP/SprF family type IX secretion system membrane protein [Pedobacter aquatilis]MDN3587076.1 PorP/SprF family type IX secretion system membrane protein [Pedobacter aquatilis]
MKKIKIYIIGLLLIFALQPAYSQLNPMGSVYYQNQYLANPAMAGIDTMINLNGAFKAQWTSIKGSPRIQYLTGDLQLKSKKVGLGILIYNESAGLINRTRATFSYAYHLKLNRDSSYIDFGLSAGVMNEWLDLGKAIGDVNDDVLANFRDRQLYLDGDFGLAYRNDKLTVQGSLPNLKRFFKRDQIRNVVDRSIYFVGAGYKIKTKSQTLNVIEPKIVFRGIENYKGILDLGANFGFLQEKFAVSGIYHSTNSVTFGAALNYQRKLQLLLQYTTNTSALQNYSNGEFEIGLRYSFRKF